MNKECGGCVLLLFKITLITVIDASNTRHEGFQEKTLNKTKNPAFPSHKGKMDSFWK